jgi:molybdate transport system substrate-binding protein
MLKRLRFLAAIVLLVALPGWAGEPRIFAAGSLRLAMAELIETYMAKGGTRFEPVYGPSGTLRKQIENGDIPDIFASASLEHTEALYQAGIMRKASVFAHNSLCLMARPGIVLDQQKMIDLILDPKIRLGTSKPESDPAGDYTWQLFREVDKQRQGAFKTLSEKAIQLTGIAVDTKQKTLPYAAIFEENRADVFISYCTNAAATAKAVQGLSWLRFPDDVNNSGTYAVSASVKAPTEAEHFIAFILSPEGKCILTQYGFN